MIRNNFIVFKRELNNIRCRGFNKSVFKNANKTNLSYCHVLGNEPLQYTTIGKVFEVSAKKWSERIAIKSLEENVALSYHDLLQKADELAAALSEVGLQKGDRVGLWAPNSWIWQVVNISAIRAGFILVSINALYKKNELEKCINSVGLTALISLQCHKNQDFYGIIRELAPELANSQPGRLFSKRMPTLRTVLIHSDEECPGAFNLKSLIAQASSDSVNRIANGQYLIGAEGPSNIFFTSGTTGVPKAVVHDHLSIVNAVKLSAKSQNFKDGQEIICLQLPLFHLFAYAPCALVGLFTGATLVMPSISYSAKATYNAIASEKCTITHGTPPMLIDILATAREKGFESLSTLETIFTGGSDCPPQVLKSLNKETKLKNILIGYGMTELASGFCQLIDDNDDNTYNRIGKLQDHLEAKAVDGYGRTVPIGETGELCVRGYSVMKGYCDNEDQNKETLKNGWLKTGDLIQMNDNREVKILGRIKEVINRGGEKFLPKEIENVIIGNENIIEVQVFGIFDERLGQEVAAAVRLKKDKILTMEDLNNYCKNKIASFKIPKKMWIVEEFPKTPTGKIDRNTLIATLLEK